MTTIDEQRRRIANAPDPDRIPWHDLPPPDAPTTPTKPDPGPNGGRSHPEDDGTDALIAQPVDFHELLAQPPKPVTFILPPLVPEQRIVQLAGPGKAGKSLLLLWMVLQALQDDLRVLYLDYEMTDLDLHERLHSMGATPEDLANLIYLQRSLDGTPSLDTPQGEAWLEVNIGHYRPDLVIVDTWSKAVAGPEDESNTSRAFYRHGLSVLRRRHTAGLIIDHSGHDPQAKRARGSSAKAQNVDVAWFLDEPKNGLFTVELERGRLTGLQPKWQTRLRTNPTRFDPVDPNDKLAAMNPERVTDITNMIRDVGLLDDQDRPTATQTDTLAALRDAGHKARTNDVRTVMTGLHHNTEPPPDKPRD